MCVRVCLRVCARCKNIRLTEACKMKIRNMQDKNRKNIK